MTEHLVLRGTTVVDTRTGATVPDRDVVVAGDRITAVLPADSAGGHHVVDARGTWLVPGFNDMHAHYVGRRTLRLWRRTGQRFRALPASTLAVFHALYEVQLRLTKILADEGVPMIAGSDVTGASWEVPGASLHQEFDELARAGLAPLTVLQMTTVEAGRFLGLEDLGVIEPGARADLVLLDGDPTADVAKLHRVTAVVRAGRHLAAADLGAIRERVAARRSVE